MLHHACRFLVLGSAVLWLGSTGKAQPSVQVNDLEPFAHTALIPAGSDLSSIRLQGVKEVMIPTRARILTDAGYCKGAAFAEPGGSMYCPLVREEELTPAYRITYSFEGQPLVSDEFGARYFTFSVYFRPGELGFATPAGHVAGKRRTAEVAAYFRLTTSRGFQAQAVIDGENSTFCAGNHVDGLWAHTDPKCQAHVQTKTMNIPSDYITVRVDRAP